ncbi:MAG: branched-chain amino acid ABC transporter permease [Syntrophorhabdales bacterium]|jgi:branched-subunit amino acid ABC-type transport system permease component
MQLAITSLINMLVLSSMYIAVALGFAFLFNIMGIMNFAHGAIYMVAGYICYQFGVALELNLLVSMLISVAIVASFGLFLERFCFRPFFGDLNRTMVVCIGIIVVLETTVNILGGTSTRAIPAFAPGLVKAGPISLSIQKVITFIVGGALLAATVWFMKSTRKGQQMQAVSQNLEGAVLQGINVRRSSALACVMACGMASVAGCLMGALVGLTPFMGGHMLLKALELVILGGVGSLGGIFFAGLIIGGLDASLPLFVSGAASEAVGLGIIVAVMLFRPQGLFGRDVE